MLETLLSTKTDSERGEKERVDEEKIEIKKNPS